jgi:hypothetical protein
MSLFLALKRLFHRDPPPPPKDYGPCQNCETGRIEQEGEFRCYGCWDADNYEAGL